MDKVDIYIAGSFELLYPQYPENGICIQLSKMPKSNFLEAVSKVCGYRKFNKYYISLMSLSLNMTPNEQATNSIIDLKDPILLADIIANENKIITDIQEIRIIDYCVVVEEKGRISIDYTALCNYVCDAGYVRLVTDKSSASYTIYKFNLDTGYYEPISEEKFMENLIRQVKYNHPDLRQMPTQFKTHVQLDVLPFIPTTEEIIKDKEYLALEVLYEDGEVIPFKNGFYSVRYNRFLPRTSSKFVLNPLNVNFNPDALDNDIGVKYHEMVDDPCCFEYLFELMGYSLYASKFIIPTYAVLYGSGANGKSIVIDTFSRIIGEANISRISLEDMTNPHIVAQAENKRVNVVTDAGAGYRDSAFKSISAVPSFMKTASAGEPWMFNPKFKAPHSGVAPSKFIFASNNFLNLGDASDGTNRRLHAIPFTKTFEEDFSLAQRFKGEEETEWFAMRALVSFKNILNNAMNGEENTPGLQLKGAYIKCDIGKNTKLEMIIANSIVEDFIYNELGLNILDKEEVRLGLEGVENIYDSLKVYCDEVGRKCISQTKLTQHLKDHYKVNNVRTTYIDCGIKKHKYVIKIS